MQSMMRTMAILSVSKNNDRCSCVELSNLSLGTDGGLGRVKLLHDACQSLPTRATAE